MSDSIENKILAKVKKCGRGSVFFVSDFVNYGTRSSVNKALERLTADGTFMRVARGIYCYPKIMKLFNLGAVMMGHEFADDAIKDDALWESVRHHREIYTSVKDMDYTPDVRKRLVLIPREDIIDVWHQDYGSMREAMIYGNKPTWELQ